MLSDLKHILIKLKERLYYFIQMLLLGELNAFNREKTKSLKKL